MYLVSIIRKIMALLSAVLLVLCILTVGGSISVKADDEYVLNMDVVLVIDGSGSMQGADPNKITVEAFKEFVDMCDETCRLGYVVYSHEIKGSSPLVELKKEADIKKLKNDVSKLSYDSNGDTDIALGLTKALELQSSTTGSNSGRKKLIVLLSDGNTHLVGGKRTVKDSDAEMVNTLRSLHDKGIPVFSIGLNVDKTLNVNEMKRISDSTGGEMYETNTADSLTGIFARIFAKYTDSGIVPVALDNDGVVKIEVKDSSIYATYVTIYSKKTIKEMNPKLFSPSGLEVAFNSDKVRLATSDGYTLIKLFYPDKGTWKLKLDKVKPADCQIQQMDIYTTKVNQEVSSVEYTGEPVSVKGYLTGVNGILTDEDFLKTINFSTEYETDGKVQTIDLKPIENGGFVGEFTPITSGEYKIRTKAKSDNGSFSKTSEEYVLTIKAESDYIYSDKVSLVQELSAKEVEVFGDLTLEVRLLDEITGKTIAAQSDMAVQTVVTDEEGKEVQRVSLVRNEDGIFTGVLTTEVQGRYKLVSGIVDTDKRSSEKIFDVVRKKMALLKEGTASVTVKSLPFSSSEAIDISEYVLLDSADNTVIRVVPEKSGNYEASVSNNTVTIAGTGEGQSSAVIAISNKYGELVEIQLDVKTDNSLLLPLIIGGIVLLLLIVAVAAYFIFRPRFTSFVGISLVLPFPKTSPETKTMTLPRKNSITLEGLLRYNHENEYISALSEAGTKGLLKGIKMIASRKGIRFKVKRIVKTSDNMLLNNSPMKALVRSVSNDCTVTIKQDEGEITLKLYESAQGDGFDNNFGINFDFIDL